MTITTGSELGDFLRAKREMLSASAAGLPLARRRTPGLRREEVAARAGIGVDWLIRLEQGRSSSPSLATVDALARALQLTPVEHEHVRRLVKAETRAFRTPFVREEVTPAIQRVVMSFPHPAYVTGRRWDVLAWNKAANSVFGWGDLADDDRNTLITALTTKRARRLFGAGWESEARRMLAQFRATYDLWSDDPAFRSLLTRLRGGCPELARWWKSHDVRAPGSGIKTMFHPTKGTLRFEHASFQANDDASLRLVVMTPV